MTRRLITAAAAATAVLALGGLTACDKEAKQDAPVNARDTTPADLINMPDGFSNVASKCDHGNRVYVIYHGEENYGSVAVVPQDPTCQR